MIDLTQLKATLRGALKSWTMRFNAVMAALPFGLDYLMQQLPMVRDYLPTNLYGIMLMVALLGNALLRVKTNSALSEK